MDMQCCLDLGVTLLSIIPSHHIPLRGAERTGFPVAFSCCEAPRYTQQKAHLFLKKISAMPSLQHT